MKTLHIVPEVNEANGVWRVASLLTREQGGAVVPAAAHALAAAIADADEVWVHGAWLPRLWLTSLAALRSGKRLVRMTHGALSPIYLRLQSPLKKRLVSPIERLLLRRADRVVATCAAEADWIRAYEPRVKRIEVTDLKRFFYLSRKERKGRRDDGAIHILYLGRRHPLKGLQYLEEAVREMDSSASSRLSVKFECGVFDADKEAALDWCDVLVLPSLSENFGLVVAEALERGRRVITTDGAPAWDPASDGDYGGRLVYLEGYRDGSAAGRIALLKQAIESAMA